MKEILSKIREGSTIDNIAEELDMRKSTFLAMIDFMADRGYLEEIAYDCSACPLKCFARYNGTRKMYKMYMLTLAGEDFISKS